MAKDRPEIIQIPDTFDTVVQKEQLREYATSRYPTVELIRIDREKTYVDPLYRDSADRKFLDPKIVKCHIEHQPTKKLLGKYGLEQQRNVMFEVPTLFLDDLGILENNDTFLIGDLVRWGTDTYEIRDQTRSNDSYWLNTNIPFYLVLAADFYREGE